MNDNASMLYDSSAAVAALNHVDGFEPKAFLRQSLSEDGHAQGVYLDVKFRKLWFRLCHPEGKIVKVYHALTEQVAICEARVYLSKDDPEDAYIGSGTARRLFKMDDPFGESYVESAETAATGRALAEAGFGSQFADCDMTEPADASLADAPVAIPQQTPQKPAVQPAAAPKAAPAAVSKAAPAPVANAVPAAPAQKPTVPSTVEDAYAAMTLDSAKATPVDFGYNKGKTLGQIAIEKPSSLVWYVDSYKGPNNQLRAAAKYLLDKANAANG